MKKKAKKEKAAAAPAAVISSMNKQPIAASATLKPRQVAANMSS